MNKLRVFKNEQFGEIRTLMINNEPWFIGKEIASILGYSNTRDALLKHVDIEDKNTVAICDGIGNPNKVIINESGLYSLILSSKLPQAKAFKRWVTHDVLPSIRRTGEYKLPPRSGNPNQMIHHYIYKGVSVIHAVDMGLAIGISNSALIQQAKQLGQTIFLVTDSRLSEFKYNNRLSRCSSRMSLFPRQTAIAILKYRGMEDKIPLIEPYFEDNPYADDISSTISIKTKPAKVSKSANNIVKHVPSTCIAQPNLYKAELIIKLIPTATDYIEKRFMHMAAMRILFGRSYSSSLDILRDSIELKKELKKLDSKDKRLVKRAMKDSLPYKSLPKHLQSFLNGAFA